MLPIALEIKGFSVDQELCTPDLNGPDPVGQFIYVFPKPDLHPIQPRLQRLPEGCVFQMNLPAFPF